MSHRHTTSSLLTTTTSDDTCVSARLNNSLPSGDDNATLNPGPQAVVWGEWGRVGPRQPEPTTPERPRTQGPLANILNVFQQITPSKSDRDIRGAARGISRRPFPAKDSEIADLSNQVVPTKNRRRRKRFHRADDADDSVDNPSSLEERVRKAGRRFAVNEAAFFIDEVDIWTNEAEDEFDYAHRIQDLLRLLPNDARSRRTQEWVGDAFVDGMGGQRSAAVHRIRHASLAHLSAADELKHFATASDRFEHFKDRVGYVAATETKEAFYSAFKAPILYDQFDGELDVDHLFRNPLLLKIYACILRGPDGADGLLEGRPHQPQAQCVQRIHHISRTSTRRRRCPRIWLYSADTKFQRRGDQTDINYVQRHMDYVEQLRKALTSKKAWVIDLLKYWDDILFPDADNDDGAARGGDDDEMGVGFRCLQQRSVAQQDHAGEDENDNNEGEQDPGKSPTPRRRRRDSTDSSTPTPQPPRVRRRTEGPDNGTPPQTRRRNARDQSRSAAPRRAAVRR
ncbi:hypothetical protein R3P38DRAFT_3245466 [Favolaschia claudopus]|uniref:Uncharacterized protein n=1 Tax=Favolaschia claudopus TaxID=2862362 RepID=A0AAV9Z0E0_9AGAR